MEGLGSAEIFYILRVLRKGDRREEERERKGEVVEVEREKFGMVERERAMEEGKGSEWK